MLSSLDPSLHHYYITTYYSNILSNIVYIILKVDIIVCVVYIIITKLYDNLLPIVISMCNKINKVSVVWVEYIMNS